MDLRTKFEGLATSLKAQLFERGEVVDGMMNAAIAGEHVLLVGVPGTAKSALVTAFTQAVTGASYFEWLLGRFTVPEELFGPLSLKALEEEKYRRVTEGKLPQAHVAFLDEVFKGNSAILNTLLPIMNERKFYNNGAPQKLQLRMLVGASNELPEGAELAAMYDRFLVRFSVDYIKGAQNWVSMIMSSGVTTPSISLEEWDAARDEAAKISMDRNLVEELHKLRDLLSTQNVTVSDRRWKQCVKLLKAEAWRMGDTEVSEEHFKALTPALWNEVTQVQAVREACEQAAGATSQEAARIVKQMKEVIGRIPAPNPGEKVSAETQKMMVSANHDGSRGLARLKELVVNAKTPRSKRVAESAVKELEEAMRPMRQTMRAVLEL